MHSKRGAFLKAQYELMFAGKAEFFFFRCPVGTRNFTVPRM